MSTPTQLSNSLTAVLATLLEGSITTREMKQTIANRLDALTGTDHPQSLLNRDRAEKGGTAGTTKLRPTGGRNPLTPLQKVNLQSKIAAGQKYIRKRSRQLARRNHHENYPGKAA